MITKITYKPHAYRCKGCDRTYNHLTPREGYIFEADITIDEMVFKEGDETTLKGTHSWVCHDDDDAPCVLEEDDWFTIVCYAYKCDDCGQTYTYDNEYCSAHSYSDEEGAKEDAINCCNKPEVPAEPGPPIILTKETSPEFFRLNMPNESTWVSVYSDVIDGECVLTVTDTGGWTINDDDKRIPKSLTGTAWWVRKEAVATAVAALMPAVSAATVLPKAEPDDDDLMSKMRKKDAPKKIVEL